ncbi:MAG: archease [Chloroflexi bacterium]|nr:archease [Chloroflexota bacterium]
MDEPSGSWPSGVEEIEHTADWAMRVTAPNASELFRRAAMGLYHLAGMRLTATPRYERRLQLTGVDWECLLVAWLNELLFLEEHERLAYDEIQIVAIGREVLQADLRGGRVIAWTRDIKAVTFHNLRVEEDAAGWRATIVFDV